MNHDGKDKEMKKPHRTNRKSLIVGEWLSPMELARLCGVTSSAIRKRISRGVYRNIKIDESTKQGLPDKGKPRRIHIFDPAIPEDVRSRWKLIQEQTFGLTTQRDDLLLDEIREIKTMLKSISELANK